LAGAVFAAAVVLHPRRRLAGLADSKQLSEGERERLGKCIRRSALGWCIASASAGEIDRLNILQATLLAMQRAVQGLSFVPDEVLVDGLHCPRVPVGAVRAIVRGDQTVAEISAASILAKTARDAEMVRLHASYPQYGFARHKGYPTPEHLHALRCHGACPIHRRSFAPVREVLRAEHAGSAW
jgi:ribonuclease HII